jgi:hypothetical protein
MIKLCMEGPSRQTRPLHRNRPKAGSAPALTRRTTAHAEGAETGLHPEIIADLSIIDSILLGTAPDLSSQVMAIPSPPFGGSRGLQAPEVSPQNCHPENPRVWRGPQGQAFVLWGDSGAKVVMGKRSE